MNPVEVHSGNSPVVLGLPHTGTHLPDDIHAQLTPLGQSLADTDWHVERLYDGLLPGVTTVMRHTMRRLLQKSRSRWRRSVAPPVATLP